MVQLADCICVKKVELAIRRLSVTLCFSGNYSALAQLWLGGFEEVFSLSSILHGRLHVLAHRVGLRAHVFFARLSLLQDLWANTPNQFFLCVL